MKKLVMLNPEVNAHAVRNVDGERADLSYFVRHIEGKELRVVSETAITAEVRDEEDEVWTVKRSDLIPVSKFNTVGQELTQGRRASA